MAEKKKAEKETAKYRPVHEIIIEFLTGDRYRQVLLLGSLLYTEGAKVPPEDIPTLISAFEEAKAKELSHPRFTKIVFAEQVKKPITDAIDRAITTLKQQLAEAEKEKEEEKRRIKEEIPIQ